MKKLFSLIFVIAIVGCGQTGTGPAPSGPAAEDSGTPTGGVQEQYEDAANSVE